jgi:hypothetical protein
MSSKGFVNQFKNTRRQTRVDRMKSAKKDVFPFRKKKDPASRPDPKKIPPGGG